LFPSFSQLLQISRLTLVDFIIVVRAGEALEAFAYLGRHGSDVRGADGDQERF
jgi:hypothetical protein